MKRLSSATTCRVKTLFGCIISAQRQVLFLNIKNEGWGTDASHTQVHKHTQDRCCMSQNMHMTWKHTPTTNGLIGFAEHRLSRWKFVPFSPPVQVHPAPPFYLHHLLSSCTVPVGLSALSWSFRFCSSQMDVSFGGPNALCVTRQNKPRMSKELFHHEEIVRGRSAAVLPAVNHSSSVPAAFSTFAHKQEGLWVLEASSCRMPVRLLRLPCSAPAFEAGENSINEGECRARSIQLPC